MARPIPNSRATPLLTTKLTAGWQDFQNLVDPKRFQARYRQAISQATATNLSNMLKAVRQNIAEGTYSGGQKPNAPLTVAIKGKNDPLSDLGKLPKIFTTIQHDFGNGELGVKGGDDVPWIVAIHEGAKIKVTDEMRSMFDALAAASEGEPVRLRGRAAALFARKFSGWRRLRASTHFIKIPKRPFFRDVVENRGLQAMCARNWQTAAAHAVAGFPVNYSSFEHL